MNKPMLMIGVIMMAILGILAINMITSQQTGQELDYYLLKDTTEAAMNDALTFDTTGSIGVYRMDKESLRLFYEVEAAEHKYLEDYERYDKNQLRKMTHLERFEQLGKTVLFDYKHRSPLTKEACTRIVKI